ncbi:extracellular solute-binding protein [Amaricoccus macauensis]|uniref:extracellular solute-binding protein n=1 Tax=Amaricoccus macauensis TaxID=57001 RepID=UPI003C7A4CA9
MAPQTLSRPHRSYHWSGLKGFGTTAKATSLAIALTFPGMAFAEVLVSHGVSTFGELKYPPDFRHFDYVNPDAPRGGTMSFRGTGASQTFDSLNPFILKGEPAQGLTLLYDSLLSGSADEPDSAYGLLAETIEYPADRSWVIFNMRSDATFSDGEPVTADDVVFTYEVLLEKGAPSYKIILRDIESVEALGEHRVRFTFREEAPKKDLPALAGGLSILPEHYYESFPFEESTLEPPVGSGPYVVDRVDPGKSIRYCRRPDYWGDDLPVNVGVNNFDCYVYEYFADNNASFEALKVGQYLFHQEFYSALWATAYNFPAIDNGWVVRDEIPDARPSGTQGFWFNLRRQKFQDPRLREAIGLMFNFEWTNETLFYGAYERTDSFWENTADLQAEGVPEGDELAILEEFRDELPPEIFTEPAWSPPVMTSRQLDRGALRQATALLDEAGWTVGENGMRQNAEGVTLKIDFVDDNSSFERVMNPYVQNLRRLGIDASYRQIDPAQMQQRLEDFDFDLVPGRFSMSLSPSLELRQLFSSEAAETPGSANYTGLADPVVDALIEEVISADSRDELVPRVRALDRVLRIKQIWVPNWYSGVYRVAYWDVFGRPDVQPPYARGDAFWWFDQEKFDALKAQGALR